jgi:hypothetical protein
MSFTAATARCGACSITPEASAALNKAINTRFMWPLPPHFFLPVSAVLFLSEFFCVRL